jgi:hypothetical protein
MAQAKIPTELLLHIINYLAPNDKRQGLLTCKDWYEAFRYSLYININIQNICQLKLLFKSLLSSNHYNYSQHHSAAIPNGHLMRSLVIHKKSNLYLQKMIQERVIIPRVLFEQLPDLCPNLETLDFDPETWKFICYHNSVSKWKRNMRQLPTVGTIGASLPFLQSLGEGLVSLSIQSGMILDISTQSKLSAILRLVPNILELTIQGDVETNNGRPTTLSLTMPDLELIHKLLPRLESFNIVGDNIHMPIGDASTSMLDFIENLPTVVQIKTLHWNTSVTPVAWVLYVSHKYPSVQNLTLALQSQQQPAHQGNNQDHFFSPQHHPTKEEEAFLYTRLIQKCRHLEKISLSCSTLNDWFNSAFFEILTRSSCIKQVCPIMQNGNQIKYDSELALALQPNIRSLITALEIEQWRLDIKLPCTLDLLKNFTKLVYLELKCDSYHGEYNVETLLDSCPHLKNLTLEWGTLSTPLPQNPGDIGFSPPLPHPLQTLNITYVAFSPDIFYYFSKRCRLLSRLLITKCKQLCEMKNASSQTLIKMDMPYNNFDLIMIDGVRLDYSNASMFYSGLSSYIRLAVIQDHINTAGASSATETAEKWYQHVAYAASNKKAPIAQLLSDEDTEVTQDYFSKREQCTFVNNNHQYLETLGEEQKISNALRTSLVFGVIKIKCKSLQNFVLDGNVAC